MNARDKRRAIQMERGICKLRNKLYEVLGDEIMDAPKAKPIWDVLEKLEVWAWRLGSGRESELVLERAKRFLKRAGPRMAKLNKMLKDKPNDKQT